jgi:hypothetical protein
MRTSGYSFPISPVFTAPVLAVSALSVPVLFVLVLSALFLSAAAACAQDPGTAAAMQASQMATQAAQQANQQAMQDAQNANQLANQQAMDNISACCGFPLAASPHFSVRPGSYTSAIDVRLTDRTRGAIIYYTTDGWTPTPTSTRYIGPITISSTTTLQAMAFAHGCTHSLPASVTYTFPGSSQPQPAAEMLPVLPAGKGNLLLRLDAPVPLLFAASVDSHTAQVGDKIGFTLAADLKAGDRIVAPKGSAAVGKVIQVDHRGLGGLPGEIVFEVDSLSLNGTEIPLRGSEALAGKAQINKARSIAFIPFVGITAVAVHGQDARIAAGTALTATMPAGTVLPVPGQGSPD